MDLITTASKSSASTITPATDLEILEQSIQAVSDMLDRVLTYVRSVLAGEVKGDPAVGRYLMDTLGASTSELEKGGFNTSLQVSFSRLGPRTLLTECTGHTHGFVSRKPCSCTSRSVRQACVGHLVG